jgi:hypothetical protein
MVDMAGLNDLILKNILELGERDKKEVLNFIEYLKIKEDRFFIEYVNNRAKEAMEARQSGERFVSLKELQRDYA